MWCVVRPPITSYIYIPTSAKRKLKNIDVSNNFAGDNEIMSRPNCASVKDIDIDIYIADILGQKYRFDPPLVLFH